MALRVYNTLTRKKELFEPLVAGRVFMYVCGPTVYDRAHVGHAMSVLVFDVIRRYLEYRGYAVRQVMNYTDVDDKIIQRAQAEGVDALELAQRYIGEFERHLKALNVLPAAAYPRATREIGYIIRMVQGLIENGYAYQVDGDVYFRVRRFPEYGKLSGRRLEEMMAGARIEVDERKEHPMDFALWKSSKPGEPAWDSPWGKGRPGWHIECSAMNLHHLGDQIDLHGGGSDLIFPHHENEIAQTECFTGKPFVRYWIHNGMMKLSGEKMSKSLGNLVTIADFLAQHEAGVLRLMVLNSSYRSPLAFSDETVESARGALERLRSALRPAFPGAPGGPAEAIQALDEQARVTCQGFIEAMDDDFNTPRALGHLFDLVRAINQARDAGATRSALREAQELLRELFGVFGLALEDPEAREKAPGAAPFVELLVEARSKLREQNLWELADWIRARLVELGVTLEDGKGGTLWRWK